MDGTRHAPRGKRIEDDSDPKHWQNSQDAADEKTADERWLAGKSAFQSHEDSESTDHEKELDAISSSGGKRY